MQWRGPSLGKQQYMTWWVGPVQEVEERAMRATIDWGKLHPCGLQLQTRWPADKLEEAYLRCGTITSDYAKTFYLVSPRLPVLYEGAPSIGHQLAQIGFAVGEAVTIFL